MPTYLYHCPNEAHGKFEEIHSIHTVLENCPHCEKEGVITPIKRLINFGSAIRIELGREEIREKTAKDIRDFRAEVARDENLRANLIGEDKYNKSVIQKENAIKTLGKALPKQFRRV